MREIINLIEGLDDWSGDWIHFSKEPHLSINPKPLHQDPLGIYFFPEKFVPIGMWTKYPYRFRAQINPSARILDVARITPEQIDALIDLSGCRDKYDAHIERWPPKNTVGSFDTIWSIWQAHYAYEHAGTRLGATFNKMLRTGGYEAVFDDTGSVHSSEVQLLVLDPRCVKVISLDQAKGSGFAEIEKMVKQVVELCQPYGSVSSTPPRKYNRRSWGTPVSGIAATVRVEKSEKNYLEFTIEAEPNERDISRKPSVISVSSSSSRPWLRSGFGVRYNIASGEFEFRTLDYLKGALDEVFSPKAEKAA